VAAHESSLANLRPPSSSPARDVVSHSACPLSQLPAEHAVALPGACPPSPAMTVCGAAEQALTEYAAHIQSIVQFANRLVTFARLSQQDRCALLKVLPA